MFILYKLLKVISYYCIYQSVFVKYTKNFDKMEHHAQSIDDALIGGLSCEN